MGFTVTLKPSSIEVRPGELSRERTIENILAADASAGRLVVFERPGKENGLRRVLRTFRRSGRDRRPGPTAVVGGPIYPLGKFSI